MPLAEYQRAQLAALASKLLDAGLSDSMIQARIDSAKAAMPDATKGGGHVGRGLEPSYTDETARNISDWLNRNRANIYGAAAGLAAGPEIAAHRLMAAAPAILRAILSSTGAGMAGQAQSEMERTNLGMQPHSLLEASTNVARAGPEQAMKEATGIGLVRGGGWLGRQLAKGSLREPSMGSSQLEKLAQTMIEERIPVGSFKGIPGSERATTRFKMEYGADVNRAAREAHNRGVMISSDDISQFGIDRVNSERIADGRGPLTAQQEQNIRSETMDTMNSLLSKARREQSANTNMYTPMEVLRASRTLNHVLRNRYGVSAEFQNLATNQGLQTDLQSGTRASVAGLPAETTPTGARTLAPSRFIRGETGAPRPILMGDLRRRVGEVKDLAEALKTAEGRVSQHAYGFSTPTIAGRMAGSAAVGNVGTLPARELGGAAAAATVMSRKLMSRAALGLTEPAVQDILMRQLPRYILPYWLTNQTE